jgi:type III pantothenate kinase
MSKIDSSNPKKTLYLDIGNSSIKAAFNKDGVWIKEGDSFKSVTYLISWLDKHEDSIEELIVASVRKDHFTLLENQIKNQKITQITIHDISVEMLDYSTPKTLGIDRYLGCLGAFESSKKGVVVIDAGSACTIDMMDNKGIYRGGIIMPGLNSLMNIFKSSAPELPDIGKEIPQNWPGKNTSESLQWGQVGFFIDGIESALKRYKDHYGDYELYITGGDSEKISSLISGSSIKDEFLIFKGMEVVIND